MSAYWSVTRVLTHENSVEKYQSPSNIEDHKTFHLNNLVCGREMQYKIQLE